MTHNTGRAKIFTLVLGLALCLAAVFGVASGKGQPARAEETAIDTLEVAFGKAGVGDSLADAFVFEDESAKTLKVPDGANYTATLTFVFKNGQATTLWKEDNASFPWSRVENQTIERKVAYCIRVRFAPKENYKLSKDGDLLKRNLKVSGAELGKGKDIEIWDVAGQNFTSTIIDIDFIISRGMTYLGYPRYISPRINEKVSGKIGTDFTDTGMWIGGAPAPYTYEAKVAPVGMEIQTVNVFDESNCYYQIIAKNAMDGGTMYVTATAADGQTCDIPVTIAAVSGGHEHTWVEEIGKIDHEHHGYTKCTDPACPGVSPAFDKGSQFASHEFYPGCNAKCKTCGDLGNPEAKHGFSAVASDDDSTCHVFRCACGEIEKDGSGNAIKEEHSGGTRTCLNGALCDECGKEYLAATGHKYEFRSFGNGDGTYTHLGFCRYCGKENTDLRHSPTGGAATCQARAKCAYMYNGDVCGCEYGDFKAHNFVGGICTECSSDEYIREVVIDVPEYYEGMAYSPLFYPNVVKGNVIPNGLYSYKASSDLDGNDTLCNAGDCDKVFVTNNSVMCYAFKPHTTCKFPGSVDEINVSVTHGELLSKKVRESDGSLVVMVLLRVESAVQSLDIEVSRPLVGNVPETLQVTEKNGCDVTINTVEGYLHDGKFYDRVTYSVEITIKAPEGKVFPTLKAYDIPKWLCDYNITGGTLISCTQSADLTELTLKVRTSEATDCLHENVTMKEAGKLATCTEDGIKDKYACAGCGKEFFDAACTREWNDKAAALPKTGHDLDSGYTADKDKHYRVCKTCGEKEDEAPHDFGALFGQTEPTCMQNGVRAHYECSVCKKVVDGDKNETTPEDLKIPADPDRGHRFDVWKEEVPATDAANGIKAHKDCLICGKHYDANGKEISAFDLVIPKYGTHKVTVNGELRICVEGTSVTAVAEDPADGKEFKGWKDADGNIVSTDKTYTFTVTGETTLTAVYGDKASGGGSGDGEISSPSGKEGLSGGAIAGIAAGSAAAAGIGGFSVLWFAVKKKSFADLIAAIKGIFGQKS